jgi:hypothetical protein
MPISSGFGKAVLKAAYDRPQTPHIPEALPPSNLKPTPIMSQSFLSLPTTIEASDTRPNMLYQISNPIIKSSQQPVNDIFIVKPASQQQQPYPPMQSIIIEKQPVTHHFAYAKRTKNRRQRSDDDYDEGREEGEGEDNDYIDESKYKKKSINKNKRCKCCYIVSSL